MGYVYSSNFPVNLPTTSNAVIIPATTIHSNDNCNWFEFIISDTSKFYDLKIGICSRYNSSTKIIGLFGKCTESLNPSSYITMNQYNSSGAFDTTNAGINYTYPQDTLCLLCYCTHSWFDMKNGSGRLFDMGINNSISILGYGESFYDQGNSMNCNGIFSLHTFDYKWNNVQPTDLYPFNSIFEPVEYAQSDGTQAVNTGVNLSTQYTDLRIEVEFALNNVPQSQPESTPCGCGNHAGYYGYYFLIPRAGNVVSNFMFDFGDARNGSQLDTGIPLDTNKHTAVVDFTKDIVAFDDVETSVTLEKSNFGGATIIFLFKSGKSGSPSPYGAGSCKIYSAKFYSGTTLIRDFSPYGIKGTSVATMYDNASNTLYDNDGNALLAGPIVHSLTCTYTTTDDSTPVTVGYDTYADLKTNLTQNSNYKEKLLSVTLSGKGQDTDASDLFNECQEITSLDITELDTSNVTNFQSAFYAVTKLRSLDLSNLDTSSCTNMGAMFALTNFTKDLSNFDTSNVTTMQGMFGMAIGELIFGPGWDTSNVTTFRRMFYLSDLTGNVYDIDFTTWDTSSCVDMERMFATSNMARMDLSTWDISNVTDISRIFASLDVVTEIRLPETLPASGALVDGMFDYSALTSPTSPITTIYCNNDWSTIVTASTSVFKKCTSLVGAISYDAEKISSDYMNPTTGYFTPYSTSIPFKFNGNEVNEIYFNSNKLNHLYFNTNQVF